MKYYRLILLILFFCTAGESYAQDDLLKKLFSGMSLTTSLNYVSSATILLNPNNIDLIERSSSEEVKGGYGYGFTLKKRIFGEDMYIGISTEYLKINDDQIVDVVENDFDFQRVRITETIEMIPVELSVYFNIPKFTNDLNIFLGGGAGVYFGTRTRKMANLEAVTVSKDPMFSLNVLFGAEYILDKHFTLNLEMKVRDGYFKSHNRFPVGYVIIDNQAYYFPQDFESKIYVDGLKVSLGIGYYF